MNAVLLKVTNGPAEGINSRIKMVKVRSRGFRNKQRFATAIYFHLGGLDLYPSLRLWERLVISRILVLKLTTDLPRMVLE
uniref:Transposase n=2 Tax=Candidatus Kentrum sp. LPFa TaxID=2126335 RepID=A0A450X8H5_9GAMM|nr:MAG: Transposase [Candidatus Kentron sp. LPFa]